MKRRALIVDDNRALAEDLGEILELEGYEVMVFDDSTRALRECAMQPFDVALLDVRMPGLDGVALHRGLLERHPNTHFFMMTAYTEDERIASALAAGVRRVLTKPVPLADLLQILEQESGAGRELLLLDDDAHFNATLAEVLRDSGYHVHSAHSLAEARRVERADPWLAAIVDMRLPDGDGVSFAMELARRTPASVILVSGFELEGEGERLRKEFGERVQVLVKPFAPELLLKALFEKSGLRT